MYQAWYKTAIWIASLFAFRMLGLFMLIPVFTIYAVKLTHSTPYLIGLALGSYGLAQGILQIPFGMLSDKYGRKPILLIGFSLFAVGSLIGALSTSIYSMILARTLQGAGAIGSVLIALLSDLVPTEKRTHSMAIIGSTIGISFSLAMILSPYITKYFALPGIFYLTIILAIMGIFILLYVFPNSKIQQIHQGKLKLKDILLNKDLLPLNLGIFIQHFVLTSSFFAIPMLLQKQIQNGVITNLWNFYLPVVLLGFILMVPCIIITERKHKVKPAFIGAVLITLISQLLLIYLHDKYNYLQIILIIYFIAFNFLEANLPSLISKVAPINIRGTAMGVYSSSQFLGIFAGGSLAGIIFKAYSFSGVFALNSIILLIWLLLAKQQTCKP